MINNNDTQGWGRWYNTIFHYSTDKENIVKSRQTGIAAPIMIGLETGGNLRWNVGLGATPFLALITVTTLNFEEDQSKNRFKSGKYTQLIGDNLPIENSDRSEYINPAKGGYDIYFDIQTGFSFLISKKQRVDCYIKLRKGSIKQIETRAIGQFGIVSVETTGLHNSLLFGIRYYL